MHKKPKGEEAKFNKDPQGDTIMEDGQQQILQAAVRRKGEKRGLLSLPEDDGALACNFPIPSIISYASNAAVGFRECARSIAGLTKSDAQLQFRAIDMHISM